MRRVIPCFPSSFLFNLLLLLVRLESGFWLWSTNEKGELGVAVSCMKGGNKEECQFDQWSTGKELSLALGGGKNGGKVKKDLFALPPPFSSKWVLQIGINLQINGVNIITHQKRSPHEWSNIKKSLKIINIMVVTIIFMWKFIFTVCKASVMLWICKNVNHNQSQKTKS